MTLAFVEDDVAVFAHDFDVQMPEGGFPGRRANCRSTTRSQSYWIASHQCQTTQLMQQLLAEGKRIWCPRWIADTKTQLGDAGQYLAHQACDRADTPVLYALAASAHVFRQAKVSVVKSTGCKTSRLWLF